ncbi:MAG TPA: hypothetical protein VJR27_03035 [Candidatus Saccharimonadales bacterium]|nr:hypothetical protein [Candidatus Saccharimonadales bacterium]
METRPRFNPSNQLRRRAAVAGVPLAALLAACGPTHPVDGQPSVDPNVVTTTPPPSWTAVGAPSSAVASPKLYRQVQEFGANVFADFHNNGGAKIGHISAGDAALMACIEYDPQYSKENMPGSTTRGLWYKTDEGSFIPTNTFWNQENIGAPDLQNIYDPAMAGVVCADSPSQQLPPAHPTK